MKRMLIVALLLYAADRPAIGQTNDQANAITYCNVREMQNVDAAGMILTLSSNSASLWMEHEGYPISGAATLTETNLTIVYTNLPKSISDRSPTRTQIWRRVSIQNRDCLLGPVALDYYKRQGGIVPFDALIRLSTGENPTNVPKAVNLGIKLAMPSY